MQIAAIQRVSTTMRSREITSSMQKIFGGGWLFRKKIEGGGSTVVEFVVYYCFKRVSREVYYCFKRFLKLSAFDHALYVFLSTL